MTKVKICGLRTLADVRLVNQYLPDYVGFVFAKTRRLVADDQALLMRQMLDQRIQAVGVFVNEPIAHVIRLCDMNAIDAVQLHGDEPESYIRQIKDKTGITVIKAVRIRWWKICPKMLILCCLTPIKKAFPAAQGSVFRWKYCKKASQNCVKEIR